MKTMFKTELVDNRKKNTKRSFPKEMKEEVMNRDRCCILCWDAKTMELHHVFYGSDAEYWENRNNANKLVWLCKECHYDIHSMWNREMRLRCISYLW